MRIATSYKPEAVVSKDKDDTHLHHPYLDVANERVVATDGKRRLVVVPVECDGTDVSGHIAGDLLKIARKKNRKEFASEIRERRLLVPHDIEWPLHGVLGAFPKWQETIPGFAPGDRGTITIGLSARALKSIADAIGAEEVALTFRLDSINADAGGGLEPQILVRSVYAPQEGELGVLEPTRLGKDLRKVPEPLDDTEEAERAALEEQADATLAAAGSGELNRKDLKGPAEARKPRRKGA